MFTNFYKFYKKEFYLFNLKVNLWLSGTKIFSGLYKDISYHFVTLCILESLKDFTSAVDNIALVVNNKRKQDFVSPTPGQHVDLKKTHIRTKIMTVSKLKVHFLF